MGSVNWNWSPPVTHANDETEFLARQLLDSVHAGAAGRLMEMLGLGADDLAELCKRIEAGHIDGRMWRSRARRIVGEYLLALSC
jgi:hypothetical protein